jgi:hypothetical protein
MSAKLAPLEYAHPGFEGLISYLGPEPQGELLSGRVAQVVGLSVCFNGQQYELIARTAPEEDGMPLCEGDEADLQQRAVALYIHLGDRALEQVVAYNAHLVITRRVSGETLDRLSANAVAGITSEQLDAFAADVTDACKRPFELDTLGVANTLYDGRIITAIDYGLSEGLASAGREYSRFIERTLGSLMRNSLTVDSLTAWERIALLAMDVLKDRFPDEHAENKAQLMGVIRHAMLPDGRRIWRRTADAN